MKYQLFISFLLSLLALNAQQQDKVDFIHADATIEPIPVEKKIKGFVTYEFKVLQDVDSVFLDAKNMVFTLVNLDGKRIEYNNATPRQIPNNAKIIASLIKSPKIVPSFAPTDRNIAISRRRSFKVVRIIVAIPKIAVTTTIADTALSADSATATTDHNSCRATPGNTAVSGSFR